MATAAARVLTQKEQDIQMMLAADVHLGTKNCDFQMERYVFQRRTDGSFLIRFDPLDVVNTVSFPFMFNLF